MRRLVAALPPIAIAAAPVVALYARNAAELDARVLARPLPLVMAAGAVVFLLALRLVRDAARASVLAGVVVLGLWSYGPLQDAVTRLAPGVARHRTLLPAYALAWGAALWWAARRPSAPRAAGAFGVGAAALLLGGVAPLVARSAAPARPSPYAAPTLKAGASPPDVYLLVLDSYPSARVLGEGYGWDNRPFERALEARGFAVVPDARSNYAYTVGSIPATLNMAYWHTGPLRLDRDLRLGIHESAVVRAFTAAGYRFVDLSRLEEAFGVDFPDVLARGSLLRPAWPTLQRLIMARQVQNGRHEIDGPLDTLAVVARDPRPTFTYLHVMAAHAPFVFGADGGPPAIPVAQQALGLAPADHRRLLVDQLRWLNGRVLAALDSIVAASGGTAVVLLQGDHGPASVNVFQTPTPDALRERFGILDAVRMPGAPPPPAGLTPVNGFRLVLGRYFGVELPLLPDRSWFEDWQHGKPFVDVTAIVSGSTAAR